MKPKPKPADNPFLRTDELAKLAKALRVNIEQLMPFRCRLDAALWRYLELRHTRQIPAGSLGPLVRDIRKMLQCHFGIANLAMADDGPKSDDKIIPAFCAGGFEEDDLRAAVAALGSHAEAIEKTLLRLCVAASNATDYLIAPSQLEIDKHDSRKTRRVAKADPRVRLAVTGRLQGRQPDFALESLIGDLAAVYRDVVGKAPTVTKAGAETTGRFVDAVNLLVAAAGVPAVTGSKIDAILRKRKADAAAR